jgi:D-cysteine desulfhydrase
VAVVTANGDLSGRPRFRLAVLPTPLVPALRLQAAIGGPLVWVKRDDLTGFATAGNKARALEFLVGDALAQGCDTLITGGGPGSNFCAATAAAARAAGLGCHLVMYDGAPHPNLAAALAAGAEVTYTGRADRESVDGAVSSLARELAAGGHRPYGMPRGGATAVGARGYVAAFEELDTQLGASDAAVEPGVMVVATGSGATQAGLVAASAGSLRRRRIVGATVSRPAEQIAATVTHLARALTPVAVGDVEIVDARGPGGFGVASDAGQRAARIAFETEGLVLDPVYTAKAFAVVLAMIEAGFDQPIVFWHTGGLPAALHHRSLEWSAPCPL